MNPINIVMQLVPRYLVSNRITIIANEAGFTTEYRPVYTRQVKVYKGIDNVLQFRVLNADQKPINISSYTPKFQAFDENKNLIIEHEGTLIVNDDSAASRGLFTVTVTENDLLNVKQQFLSYSIHLVDPNNNNVITYSDSHFGNEGTMYVSAEAYPGPRETAVYNSFFAFEDYWVCGVRPSDPNNGLYHIDAQPGINGNEALHTAVIYTTGYIGDLIIQATLDNQITGTTDWADIVTVSFAGTETEPKPINFNGVYSYIRFKATSNPADKIIKILVRN